MNLTEEVTSSNIKKIGYEDNTLYVQYNSDAVYAYKGVSDKLFEDFKNAESKGKFMNSEIKGKFEFEKVG